jgi:NitT/TauT family transport system substrate-binding protein
MFEVKASDEALFANLNFIQSNERAVNIFVDALHGTWTDMVKDPTIIRKETKADGPIGQLPEEVLAELDGFYKDAVEGGLYDPNGGGREAAKADMEWYTGAGQLEGDPATLNIDDFWYFAPLDAAMK